MRVRNAVMAGGLAVALVGFGACGGTEDRKVGSARGPDAIEAPDGSYRVGDIVKLGNEEVVVHGFQDPFDPGLAASKAPAGSRTVAIDAEVRNLTAEPLVISHLAQFEVKDSEDESFKAIALPANIPAVGGVAPAGGSRRGLVGFHVPEASKGLRVVFNNILYVPGDVSIFLG